MALTLGKNGWISWQAWPRNSWKEKRNNHDTKRHWYHPGRRVNAISLGFIATPCARHEMESPSRPIYRAMIDVSSAERIATVAVVLLGPVASFINDSDLLMDGGVIPAKRAGWLDSSV